MKGGINLHNKDTKNYIKFELLENGLDFVISALKYLNEPIHPYNLKYTILHLGAGIELILKERLRREHWALLFSKIDKANPSDYKNGNFTSVTLDDSIERLINVCGVNIPLQKIRHIKSLRDKRNRLEHYGIVDSIEALKATIAEALNFLIDFISDELKDELDNDDIVIIREQILKFDTFVQKRLKAIGNQLAKYRFVVTCPRCFQDAAYISDGLHCLFCGYQNEDLEDAADEYVSEVLRESKYEIVKHGGEWPIYSCPGCYFETLVRTNEGYICFVCANKWNFGDIEACIRCGVNLCFTEEDGANLCNYCLEGIFNNE